MANVTVFQKYVNGHVQVHMFKIYGTVDKALSKATHMPNMNKKLWLMIKLMIKVSFSKEGQMSWSRSHVQNLWYCARVLS